jgi:hypothetical protein
VQHPPQFRPYRDVEPREQHFKLTGQRRMQAE